ncbi:carbohydrate ABC transporter permease [Nonomuraea sp. SBT364]|uniref:carbohydrate ABC transporter permease n=1 Tax=Nonomuraea sp. SBT364 TaxID=1580530 RepID=UPI00066D8D6A|nr:sugar ABC transporter permease [Nonomuraea sp. SBT364]
MTSRTTPSPPPRALGWLLLMPAVIGMLITLVLPTVQTIAFSFESGGLTGPTEFVGLKNYGTALDAEGPFWPALGFTLSITIMPLLVALVVAPLLALALDRAGTWPRRAGRVALSLALVTFSPAAVAASWLRGLDPAAGGLTAMARELAEPGTAPGAFRLIFAAAMFGVVCALAVMAFLPALRGGTVTGSMLVVGALVALAALAAGLQTFTMSLALTRGGPLDSTQTLGLLQYTFAFQTIRLGLGASVGAVVGVVLGVLGILAVVLAAARATARMPSTPRTTPTTAPTEAPRPSLIVWKAKVYWSRPSVWVESSGPPRVSARLIVNVWSPAARAASATRAPTTSIEPVTVPPRSAGRNAITASAHTTPNMAAAKISRNAPGAVPGSASSRAMAVRPPAAGSRPRSHDAATAAGENVTRASDSATRPARRGHVPARSSASARSGATTSATSSGMIVIDSVKPRAGQNGPSASRAVP